MLQTTQQDTAVNSLSPDSPSNVKKKESKKVATIAVDDGGDLRVSQKTYTFDEVFAASLEYFGGDELAANVWATKYALKTPEGDFLEKTPVDMHRRLAREFARVERNYPNPMGEDEIFDLLDRFKYIVPQGSPMSGIGNPYKFQSISNCFVIESPADSYGGILATDQEQVQIMKRRGGVGFDLSTIRPKGLPTANAAQTTDGIEIFMDRFSNSCREVAQGGRRGALMLTLDVHHPQVRDFVKIKRDTTRVTGANISLRLSDEFMEAVEKGEQVHLRWPCDPGQKPVVEEWTDARDLWNEIIESAHACAEPGLLFWGNAKKYSPADIYSDEGFASTATNPCGEIILSPNDSCRLMVVNLASFVNDPFTAEADFDWTRYHEVVVKAQRLMDDMIDLEIEQIDKILVKIETDPEPEAVKAAELNLWRKIREAAVRGRRTGLGVTAVGDTVAMMNMRYGSDESIDFVEKMYRALAVASYDSSVTMAQERGCFPVYDYRKESDHPFIQRVMDAGGEDLRQRYETHGRRNIANTTTAPCGSVSVLTQTTSGIEPAYLVVYTRRKKINPNDVDVQVDFVDQMGDKWTEFTVRHHGFAQWQEVNGKSDADLEESPYWKATSNDVDWVQKVKLQGAAQRWICHAISNTTNVPADTTVDTIKDIYVAGWKTGCKGVTVYRDGSRSGVLVQQSENFVQHDAPKRPDKLPCEIHRSRISDGNGGHQDWIFFVGLFEDKPFEIFGGTTENIELPKKVTEGFIVKRSFKTGGKYDFYYGDLDDPFKIKDVVRQFDNPDQGWATRMISLSLRHGSPIQYIVEQLQRDKDADMFAFSKCIARVLKKYIPDGTPSTAERVCPDCGAEGNFIYEEGCSKCLSCGASKCG
jgi:ribonucleoside-diphosphate reductase alpha chain